MPTEYGEGEGADLGLIDRRKWDTLAILAYAVTLMVGLSVLTPYFYIIPEKNSNLITQGQTTLYAGWMLILAFYYKSRINNPVDATTIATQADTIRTAQNTLSTVTAAAAPNKEIKLEPGQTATATATESGTTINKETSYEPTPQA